MKMTICMSKFSVFLLAISSKTSFSPMNLIKLPKISPTKNPVFFRIPALSSKFFSFFIPLRNSINKFALFSVFCLQSFRISFNLTLFVVLITQFSICLFKGAVNFRISMKISAKFGKIAIFSNAFVFVSKSESFVMKFLKVSSQIFNTFKL